MKTTRFFLVVSILLLSCTANAQNSVFDKYNDMHNVSSVYISKTMIEMQPDLYTKDLYIGKVAGQLDAVYIVSTMDNTIKKDMRKDIGQYIEKGKYELLMKQKGRVSRSAFYVKRKGEKVKELVLITDGATSLKFIVLSGDLTLKDIQNITNYQSTSNNFIISGEDSFFINTKSITYNGKKELCDVKGMIKMKGDYDLNALMMDTKQDLNNLKKELKSLAKEKIFP